MRRIAAWGLGLAFLLAACGDAPEGDPPAPEAGAGLWQVGTLEGVSDATGVATIGEGLLVVTGGAESGVFTLPRPGPGEPPTAKPIPLDLEEEARLTGGGELAARGYRIGELWERGRDLGGVAVQAPDHVFLLERTYRIVYAGRAVLGRDGRPTRIRLDRAFTVRGAVRSKAEASDWRDFGPKTQGLASVRGERLDDLFVLEPGAATGDRFRVRALDRYGSELQYFDVRVEAPHAVSGLVHEGTRFLVLMGPGRGLLVPFQEGRWRAVVKAGRGVPGPPLEKGTWQGLTAGSGGALYLISDGIPAHLAWRRE